MGEAIPEAYLGFAVEVTAFHPSGSAMLAMTDVREPAADGRLALGQTMREFRRVQDGRAVACRPFHTDLVAVVASAAAFVGRLADS